MVESNEDMKTHKSVTLERIINAVEEDDCIGICIACGNEQGCCEPDMRKGKCETCGKDKVYAAEELMMMV